MNRSVSTEDDRGLTSYITIPWISGKDNPADMLTKALDTTKFEAICRNLGLYQKDTTVSKQDGTVT
jgi:hypothetical protein